MQEKWIFDSDKEPRGSGARPAMLKHAPNPAPESRVPKLVRADQRPLSERLRDDPTIGMKVLAWFLFLPLPAAIVGFVTAYYGTSVPVFMFVEWTLSLLPVLSVLVVSAVWWPARRILLLQRELFFVLVGLGLIVALRWPYAIAYQAVIDELADSYLLMFAFPATLARGILIVCAGIALIRMPEPLQSAVGARTPRLLPPVLLGLGFLVAIHALMYGVLFRSMHSSEISIGAYFSTTVGIYLFYFLLLVVVAMLLFVWARRAKNLRHSSLCPLCGYELVRGAGMDAGCPECGWGRSQSSAGFPPPRE